VTTSLLRRALAALKASDADSGLVAEIEEYLTWADEGRTLFSDMAAGPRSTGAVPLPACDIPAPPPTTPRKVRGVWV